MVRDYVLYRTLSRFTRKDNISKRNWTENKILHSFEDWLNSVERGDCICSSSSSFIHWSTLEERSDLKAYELNGWTSFEIHGRLLIKCRKNRNTLCLIRPEKLRPKQNSTFGLLLTAHDVVRAFIFCLPSFWAVYKTVFGPDLHLFNIL